MQLCTYVAGKIEQKLFETRLASVWNICHIVSDIYMSKGSSLYAYFIVLLEEEE